MEMNFVLEGFNDWGGRGYDDFVPGEAGKNMLHPRPPPPPIVELLKVYMRSDFFLHKQSREAHGNLPLNGADYLAVQISSRTQHVWSSH